MAVISTLSVKMDLDSSGFTRSLDDVKKKLDETGARLRGLGTQLTGAVTAPIVGAFGVAIMAASDLNESMSAVGTTYGDAADDIITASEGAAESVMMSQQQYLEAAAVLGVYGQAAGLTGDDLAAFGNDSITAAADLASFYNIPVDEALAAIQAGLRGEAEPLSRFGILMNDAAIEAYALEQGIWDGTGAMTDQQKVLARQGFILDNMGAAQGDAARTADSFANRLKTLRATLTNVAASIGNILLPYAIQLADWLQKLTNRFQGMGDRSKKIVVVIGLIAAAIGPLLLAVGTLLPVIGNIVTVGGKVIQLFKAIRLAMMSSLGPILIIIAVLAVLYLIWSKDLFGIKTKITAWFNAFKESKTFERLKEVFQQVKKAVLDFVGRALSKAVELFHRLVAAVKGPALAAFNAFKSVLATVVGAVGTVIGGIISRLDPLKSAFDGIKQMVVGLVGIFTNLFQGDLRGALDSAIDMFQGWLQYLSGLGGFILSLLSGALSAIWDAIAGVDWVGLGVSLLGYIQTAIGQLVDLGGKMAVKAGEMIGGFVDWISNYDWVGLGTSILTWIGTAITSIGSLAETLAPKGSELLDGMKNGAIGAWATFSEWFGQRKDRILDIAKLLFLPYTLYKYGDDILTGIWDGAKYVWGLIDGWFNTLVDLLIDIAKIIFLPTALYYYGDDVIRGLWNGMKYVWDLIDGWFNTLVDLLVDIAKIIFLPTALYYYGDDVMRGLWNGMKYVWGLVGGWLAGLGRAIVTLLKFIFLPTLIYFYGKDILNGFLDGMKAIWDGVAGVAKWLGGLGGKALTAIGDLSSTLWNAGWSLMNGLWDGLKRRWTDVKSWVSGLGGEIASLKGPIEVDRILLKPEGAAIMEGLLKGMQSQEPALRGYLTGLTDTIGNTAFTPPTIAAATGVAAGGIASGAITINVSGAGDPTMVASEVYSRFARELGLRGAV